ncbi:MAG: hypothetical protein ACF8XB_23535 [Planctomycetota bacterium JB042]
MRCEAPQSATSATPTRSASSSTWSAAPRAGRSAWSEIPIGTFARALADIDDEEALVRTVRIWRLVEALGAEDRRRLRQEVSRLLRERGEDDGGGGDHPVRGSGR